MLPHSPTAPVGRLFGRTSRGHRENPANPASSARPEGQATLSLTRLSDLLIEPAESLPYLLADTLPAGGVSVLAAKPKVGKSTLARNLAFCVARGEPFLGRQTCQGPVVYLALEEKRSEIQRHFQRMAAEDEDIYIHVGSAPEIGLPALAASIAEHKPVLAIIDPLLKLVRIRELNDYAEVSRALEPLITLARLSGCHLMLVHHMGKADRDGGDGILGSTALFAAVDAALRMHRRADQRTVDSIQRYGVDLPETIITLDSSSGLISCAGTIAEQGVWEAATSIVEETAGETLTELEIKQRVGGNRTVTSRAIRWLVERGHILRSGEGKRNAPYTYQVLRPAPISERAPLDHTDAACP